MKLPCVALWILVLMTGVAASAAEPAGAPPASGGGAPGESLTEINKELTNPVSGLWSMSFQQNNYLLDMGPGNGSRWNSNLNFQPVLPVALTRNWNLITRPVVPLFSSVPHPDPHTPSETDRTTAFGDIGLLEMLSPSPNLVGNWMLGVGPTFIFPTASSDYTGQGKWQVGPAGIVGYLSKKWALGVFVQNWTSFGGSGARPDTNQMNLQPLASYFLPNGWAIGYSGNVLANWKADMARDTWTVPLGLGVSKVVKLGPLPVKVNLAGQYMVHHPEVGGQAWNIQLNVTPVIPKLIKGNLFGD